MLTFISWLVVAVNTQVTITEVTLHYIFAAMAFVTECDI